MLTLIALNGQEKGRVFQLTGEQPELLGRQAQTIRLSDAQTSRRHAEIILQNNTWLIRDLGSTNGTWVNGQKIMQITELEVGDRVVLGRHQFRVSAIKDLPAPVPQPKAPRPEPALETEELAAMGIDLSEGLSADLLDEDGLTSPDLPDVAPDVGARTTDESARKPKAAAADIDNDVIDLDALLGEQAEDGIEIPQDLDLSDEPLLDEAPAPAAPPAQEPLPEPESESPVETKKPIIDDDFDIDALLGLSDDKQPPQADEIEVEPESETPIDESPEATLEAPDEPAAEAASPAVAAPADDAHDQIAQDDDILDLDALLEEPAGSQAPKPPAHDPDDQLLTARPLDADRFADLREPEEPAPSDESDEAQTRDDDSLIDIDILASAKPASDWQDDQGQIVDWENIPADQEPDEPQADDESWRDSADEVPEALAVERDEPDEIAELRTSDTAEAADETGAQDQASDADRVAVADDEVNEIEEALASSSTGINEAEKDLLLSPEEQEEAVTSYRRSKVKTFAGLILLLGVLAAAGWYGFNYVVNRADANAHPPVRGPVESTNPDTAPDTGDSTQTRPDLGSQPFGTNPQAAPQIDPQTSPPRQPEPDSVPEPTPRPTPDQSAPQTPMFYPDPFADVAPGLSRPGTPEEPQPEATPEPGPTPPQAEPEPEAAPAAEPQPSSESDPAETPATIALPSPRPDAEVTTRPFADSPAVNAPDNTSPPQAGTTADDSKNEVDLITGMIDAQHKPNDREAAQARFADARKTIYLVDASGSLVDSFPFILSELSGAIEELPRDQAFTVVFFGSDGVIEAPPAGLKWADARNKRQVMDWIAPDQGNVTAWGRGDLIQAVQQAIQYSPSDLVILSDNLTGREPSQEAIDHLIARMAELVDGKVQQVHVMQFFNRDPQNVLKTIAERFHGSYTQIIARPSPAAQSGVDVPLD